MPRALLFAAFTVLAFSVTMFAAPAPAPAAWASGEIERADATSLVIKQGTHEMTFTLGPQARITQGRKALAAENLANDIGHHVKVRYRMENATRVADRIEITATGAADTHTPKP